jgi:acyl-CoA synthetase (AMP-forming)/AMP-acid ligase II
VDDEGEKVHLNSEYPDNWFRTKDWGKIWSDGNLEVRGRCDHSINRDGLLVFFSEVERAIATIAGIDSVVVLSKGESQRGKGLVAYCVLAKGAKDISAEDIRSSCFDLLPRRAVPDQVFLLNALPMLPNGKVDRQSLIARKDEVKTLKI